MQNTNKTYSALELVNEIVDCLAFDGSAVDLSQIYQQKEAWLATEKNMNDLLSALQETLENTHLSEEKEKRAKSCMQQLRQLCSAPQRTSPFQVSIFVIKTELPNQTDLYTRAAGIVTEIKKQKNIKNDLASGYKIDMHRLSEKMVWIRCTLPACPSENSLAETENKWRRKHLICMAISLKHALVPIGQVWIVASHDNGSKSRAGSLPDIVADLYPTLYAHAYGDSPDVRKRINNLMLAVCDAVAEPSDDECAISRLCTVNCEDKLSDETKAMLDNVPQREELGLVVYDRMDFGWYVDLSPSAQQAIRFDLIKQQYADLYDIMQKAIAKNAKTLCLDLPG